jgi:hypothetical protein
MSRWFKSRAVRACAGSLVGLAFLLGCTNRDARAPEAKPSEAAASTPAATPEPEDPVLSARPGQVLELDQHGSEYVFTRAGRYAVRLTPKLVYQVDAPDMWEVYQGRYFSTSDFSGGNGWFFANGPIAQAWLPVHPCRDRSLVRVGPTARDLARALAAQPALKVTTPKPFSITGGHGFYIEGSIPDRVNSATCQNGRIALYTATRRPANWDEVSSGQVWTYWILNVHGQRMVLVGVCDTTCNEQDVKTLTGMATSVTFERTGERR